MDSNLDSLQPTARKTTGPTAQCPSLRDRCPRFLYVVVLTLAAAAIVLGLAPGHRQATYMHLGAQTLVAWQEASNQDDSDSQSPQTEIASLQPT